MSLSSDETDLNQLIIYHNKKKTNKQYNSVVQSGKRLEVSDINT